jgi:hypothetical protein
MAMQPVSDGMARRSRAIAAVFGVALLLGACAGDRTTAGGAQGPAYNDWLYHHHYWYDDDYWIWADDHPDCCEDEDDFRESLKTWYDGLDPDEQQAVKDRAEDWMEEHGIEPAAGQSARDLVLETASERWAALTPAERQQWRDDRRARIEQRRATGAASSLTAEQRAALSERAAGLDPDQRAALLESGQGTSFEEPSNRRSNRSYSNHPTPSRAGMSSGTRFRAARGGGRGGRRR